MNSLLVKDYLEKEQIKFDSFHNTMDSNFQNIVYIDSNTNLKNLKMDTLYIIPSDLLQTLSIKLTDYTFITDSSYKDKLPNGFILHSHTSMIKVYTTLLKAFHKVQRINDHFIHNTQLLEEGFIDFENSMRLSLMTIYTNYGMSIAYYNFLSGQIITQNRTLTRMSSNFSDNKEEIRDSLQHDFANSHLTEETILFLSDHENFYGCFFPEMGQKEETFNVEIYTLLVEKMIAAFKPKFKTNFREAYHQFLLVSLIENKKIGQKVIENYLTESNILPHNGFQLLKFYPRNQAEPLSMSDRPLIQRIKTAVGSHKIFSYDAHLLVLLIGDTQLANYQQIESIMNDYQHLCLISTSFNDLRSLPIAYAQIYGMYLNNEDIYEGQTLFNYEDYFLKIFLLSIKKNRFHLNYCHIKLLEKRKQLLAYENAITIIYTFILNGLNKSTTAEELFMHRNTLTYKLNELSELLNINFSNLSSDERLWLLYSLKLLNK